MSDNEAECYSPVLCRNMECPVCWGSDNPWNVSARKFRENFLKSLEYEIKKHNRALLSITDTYRK